MKFLAIFLTLLVVSPELVIAAENLPYPVRELLRRTADRPEKVAQMAAEYQREAEVTSYTGPINGGDEAKGLAISMLNSLEVARAPMGHSKIIEIVTSLNKTLAVIAAVDKKISSATTEAPNNAQQNVQPKALPYPVREALRRQSSNVQKIQSLVTQYESEAQRQQYIGSIGYGEEAKGLADSVLRTLQTAGANMTHPDIAKITVVLDDARNRIAVVDGKMQEKQTTTPPVTSQVPNYTATQPQTAAPQYDQQAATRPAKLPYPTREAVRRQTGNIIALEKKLEQAKASATNSNNAASSQQQQMLDQMLANNPALKAQLDADPSLLTQLMGGKATGLDGMEEQRLQSAMQDLQSSGAPMGHPEVAALVRRIEDIRQGLKDLQGIKEENLTDARKANDLSKYPDYRKHLNLVSVYMGKFSSAIKAGTKVQNLVKDKAGREEKWYFIGPVTSQQMSEFKEAAENISSYKSSVQSWRTKYEPLFQQNPNFRQQWKMSETKFEQGAQQFEASLPASMNAIAKHIRHNLAMAVLDAEQAKTDGSTAFFRGGVPALKGIADEAFQYYPQNLAANGYPSHESLASEMKQIHAQLDTTKKYVVDNLFENRKMAKDDYKGSDAQTLKTAAIEALLKKHSTAEVVAVSICCEGESDADNSRKIEVHVASYLDSVTNYGNHSTAAVHKVWFEKGSTTANVEEYTQRNDVIIDIQSPEFHKQKVYWDGERIRIRIANARLKRDYYKGDDADEQKEYAIETFRETYPDAEIVDVAIFNADWQFVETNTVDESRSMTNHGTKVSLFTVNNSKRYDLSTWVTVKLDDKYAESYNVPFMASVKNGAPDLDRVARYISKGSSYKLLMKNAVR